ncbi:MAG: hypothetical protein CM15mP74_02630 [Halieaceae bacterium]|nr:MAG: hypothetical protein CM15mP74_02630 [Halieaceae bacterium]
MPHLREDGGLSRLGLISGSLAGALRASGWRGELLGWGPGNPPWSAVKHWGSLTGISLDLESVVAEADMIVVGAPPQATVELLPEVIALARSSGEPIVTDLASIKSVIVDAVQPAIANLSPDIRLRAASIAVLMPRSLHSLRAGR